MVAAPTNLRQSLADALHQRNELANLYDAAFCRSMRVYDDNSSVELAEVRLKFAQARVQHETLESLWQSENEKAPAAEICRNGKIYFLHKVLPDGSKVYKPSPPEFPVAFPPQRSIRDVTETEKELRLQETVRMLRMLAMTDEDTDE